ncbi:MAG: hypothetical protein M3P18_22040, partial [Actinomycetota bacterium]|nr:hypothetical protein [Actinomycetota bacterium]
VRHVAYETLSKRERKIRHLAAAAYVAEAFANEDEVAEVLASHYVAAFDAAPEAEDAQSIRSKAREMLARAGQRAGSLGAPDEGQRYYEQAAALADEPLLEAALLEQAGGQAVRANRPVEAREQLERALNLYAQAGEMRAAARASAALADADLAEGRLEEGVARLEHAVAQLEQGKPSGELAGALAELGRMRVLSGHWEGATAPLEQALTLAERLQLPRVFVEALTSKALVVVYQGRLAEARILLEAAVQRAHLEQLYASALRAENNLEWVLEASDRYGETLELLERSLALARRRGDRRWQSNLRTGCLIDLVLLGRWDEALTISAEEEADASDEAAWSQLLFVTLIRCERGNLEPARAMLATRHGHRDSDNPQVRTGYAVVEARLLRAQGRPAEALAAAEGALAEVGQTPIFNTGNKLALVEALEAALVLPDLDKAEDVLSIPESLDPGELTPFLQGHSARLRARLDAARGNDEQVDKSFRTAAGLFSEFGLTFYLAVTQLEYAEWLMERGRAEDAQPLLTQAQQTFDQLRATPWIERTTRAIHAGREPEGALS